VFLWLEAVCVCVWVGFLLVGAFGGLVFVLRLVFSGGFWDYVCVFCWVIFFILFFCFFFVWFFGWVCW